jgi:hypothetical protein
MCKGGADTCTLVESGLLSCGEEGELVLEERVPYKVKGADLHMYSLLTEGEYRCGQGGAHLHTVHFYYHGGNYCD